MLGSSVSEGCDNNVVLEGLPSLWRSFCQSACGDLKQLLGRVSSQPHIINQVPGPNDRFSSNNTPSEGQGDIPNLQVDHGAGQGFSKFNNNNSNLATFQCNTVWRVT